MTNQALQTVEDHAPTVPEASAPGIAPLAQLIATGQMSLEQVRELRELQKEYEADEARKAYHHAMASARAVMGSAKRGAKNTHLGTQYASLDDLIEAARPALTAHGLSFSWGIDQSDGRVTATCKITHAQGHTESTSVTMPVGEPIRSREGRQVTSAPQTVGIAITYAKRYGFSALVGIATEDDDGNARPAQPAEPMLTAEDMADIRAVCDEAGKDFAKWLAWAATKWSVVEGVVALPQSQKGALISQIRKQAAGAQ